MNFDKKMVITTEGSLLIQSAIHRLHAGFKVLSRRSMIGAWSIYSMVGVRFGAASLDSFWSIPPINPRTCCTGTREKEKRVQTVIGNTSLGFSDLWYSGILARGRGSSHMPAEDGRKKWFKIRWFWSAWLKFTTEQYERFYALFWHLQKRFYKYLEKICFKK